MTGALVIDAHHHLWQLGRNGCRWPTSALSAIYRDFELQDFLPLAQSAGVSGSVLVQSQACDADTDYLLRLAQGSDFIKAVVGWVDLAAADAPARIARLMQVSGDGQPSKLRSVRPMLQDLNEVDWVLRSELAPAIAALKSNGLAFDALVKPCHLPALREFAQRHPELPIVINHGAKPAISASHQSTAEWCKAEWYKTEWYKAMAAMASLPNVYCKLSGLPTLAGAGQGASVFSVYLTCLYDLFGSERLMWGSDWPVSGLAANRHWAGYANWLAVVQETFAGLGTRDIEQIFAGTCCRFYQIT